MRFRMLGAVLVAALAVAGLTACSTKVGAAAFVDSTRISQTEVGKYLKPGGIAPSASASAAAAGSTLSDPKVTIAGLLVQQAYFRAALAKSGGVPTAAALGKLHDEAAATFLGAQETGAQLDQDIDAQQATEGFSSGFRNLLLNTIELEGALVQRSKAASLPDLVAAVAKYKIKVKVSASYGHWDASRLSVTTPDAAVPSFIHLSGTASPSASTPAG